MHIKAQIFRGFHLCHNYSSILFFNYRQKESVTIHPADVILFEGILTIYFKELRDLLDMKLFVDSDSDTRLSRRGIYNLWKLDISLITRMQSNVFGLEKVLYTPIILWWLCLSKRNSLQPCFSVKTTPQIQTNFFFVINFTLTCGQMRTFRLVCFFSIYIYKTCRLNEFWTEFVIFDLPPFVDRCEPFGWCTASSAFYIIINDSKDSNFQVVNHILC